MTRYLLQLLLSLCIAWPAPTFSQDTPNAEALYSLVVDIMQSEDGLLPVFEKTTVSGMRKTLFGEYERYSDFKDSWRLSEWDNRYGNWYNYVVAIKANLDYLRFIKLPAELEVSYSSRRACPADPYLETDQFVSISNWSSVPSQMAEMFAYYHYLEQALEVSMGSDNPLDMARRETILAQAEELLNVDGQLYSHDELRDKFHEFEDSFYEEISNFSNNEYAFQKAESGLSPAFVYFETWNCGGYEGDSYYIEASHSGSEVMIISDLDYEICRALGLNSWSPEECLSWQPFPKDGMVAAGWYRVMSFDDRGTERRGNIRPQSIAVKSGDGSHTLKISIDSALR